jgi:hypothetical protein
MENLAVEKSVVDAILNNGVRFDLGKDKITLRPLLFGTILTICGRICEGGLSLDEINKGESDSPGFVLKYGDLMLECIAIAEINKRGEFTEKRINERKAYYADNLTAWQIHELFAYMLQLSGIQSFVSAIRLLWMMKTANLSPREARKGS